MSELVSTPVSQLLELTGPTKDDILNEMEEHGHESGFPTVGTEVGGVLRLCARMVDASSVFEFGSGFGYSAYWFASVLPPDGEVILTEIDSDELDLARDFLADGDLADRAVFEEGDAIEIVDTHEGPFEVVLIDNEKHRYVEAFEAVRGKVPVGGMVLADNTMRAGPVVDFDDLRDLLAGGDPADKSEGTRGIAAYIERVRADPEFETVLLALGSGVAVSYRTE